MKPNIRLISVFWKILDMFIACVGSSSPTSASQFEIQSSLTENFVNEEPPSKKTCPNTDVSTVLAYVNNFSNSHFYCSVAVSVS